MKATIKDIARECDVSIATVSLALSDTPNRVSKETRARILAAAYRLHYTPNRAAVSLATNRSHLIGLIITDLRNTHISAQFMAINEEVQKKGYTLLCQIVSEPKTDVRKIVKELVSAGVEGLIFTQPAVAPSDDGQETPKDFLDSAGIPVMCNDNFNLSCPGSDVCFNYYQSGYIATRHLAECGHTRIGCISGTAEFMVTVSRFDGYKRALKDAGIDFDERLVYQGDYTMQSGYKALSYLLGQKATAIFSFNDEMAFGVYQSARQYGITIPDDISIVSCDNVPFCDVLEVPLSTVNVPTEEMGKELARELIHLIENRENTERKTIMYEPSLILRASIAKK